MKYDTVVFDLDGTLLDTLLDLTNSVNYSMRYMGWKEYGIDDVRSFVGNGIKKLIERCVPPETCEEDFNKAFNAFKEYYAIHNLDFTKPYPGVLDLMRKLKDRGLKIAIVSNKIDSSVSVLKKKFFNDVVDIAVGDRPDLRVKPAPDSCNLALDLLKSTKETSVYIGDSEVDVQTAQNAGLDCISVLWGFRDKDFLASNGATCFAENTCEVENLILG